MGISVESMEWLFHPLFSRLNLNLEVLGFLGGMKTREPEEKPLKQRREPTTNLTHKWHRARESNLGHIGGRRVLSP